MARRRKKAVGFYPEQQASEDTAESAGYDRGTEH